MQDLNDLQLFARVVEYGGFAAAGRALGIPKSKLSRRVALLEERLGVRLIHRSSRRFAVTEIGRIYHGHCLAMLAEAEAAQEAIERTRSEPQGTVRLSCPVLLAQTLVAPVVARFMAAHPRVRLEMEVVNRRVDVIEEGFDLALRVRQPPLEESELILKVLGDSVSALVTSPRLIERTGAPLQPEDLARFDTLDQTQRGGEHVWMLTGPDGAERRVAHRPRLITDDMATLRQAALDGVGVARLPLLLVGDDLAAGALVALLPEWSSPAGLIHAVFPSRRGLVPAVRGFIDSLAAAL